MNASTLRLFSVSTLAALLLSVLPANADTFYTSRSAFNTATTSQTTIDFNGLAGVTGNTPLAGLPLVVDGATFSSPGPASITSPTYIYFPTPLYGSDYLAVDYGSPDTINVTFPGSTAVGFDAGGIFGNPATITITLSDGTQHVIHPTGDYTASGTLDFFGFTAQHPITSVKITFLPTNAQFGALDNFTYATALPPAVPEPSSFALLGTGLVVAALALRRKFLGSDKA